MRLRWFRLLVVALLLTAGAACSEEDDPNDESSGTTAAPSGQQGDDEGGEGEDDTVQTGGGDVLQTVQDRGTLVCGVNDAVPGFGVVDENGEFSGFDIDYCRAIAAAVLGDAEAVEFRPLSADERFTALQSGEVDVLVRNTTHTATRDGSEGAAFAPTTFYDGQAMMVAADSGFGSIDDMDGATICVLSGTTTELNLATRFNQAGLTFEPLSFEDVDLIQEAFIQGQCDGWTSDGSQLAGIRSAWPDAEGGPEALTIFEERFSKEPLAPAVRGDDPQWLDVVSWVVWATIQAEELGLDSTNIADETGEDSEDVARLLGLPVGEDNAVFDPGLGLPPDFVVQVVSQVGNYGEIYERNIGPLGIERGLNALYLDGGLQYAPPYR
ncbi:MAG TPA: amino acid ABC transporter substrate-binding protein [Acidimicrobiales bacterium]